jgi:hypothetical protein
MIVELIFREGGEPLHAEPFESGGDILPLPHAGDHLRFGENIYSIVNRTFSYMEPEHDAPIRPPSVRVVIDCRRAAGA